jgi:hypothetical protein
MDRYHSNNTNDPTFTDKTFYLKHGDGSVTLRKAVTDVLGRLKTNAEGTKLREPINQTVDLIEKCLEIEPEKQNWCLRNSGKSLPKLERKQAKKHSYHKKIYWPMT